MTPKVTYRRTAALVETSVNHEIVLLQLESGSCIALGETGSEVWRLLEAPIGFDPLIASLRAQYDAPAGAIEADVEALLAQMQQYGLVELQ